MTAPQRVRLSRARGYRKPEDAIVVARPTRWGNPFRYRAAMGGLVREPGALTGRPWEFEGRISGAGNRHDYHHPDGRIDVCHVRWATRGEVVELFRRALLRIPDEAIRSAWGRNDRAVKFSVDDVRAELAGRDLACWCPLDQPCHADVLLELANTRAVVTVAAVGGVL